METSDTSTTSSSWVEWWWTTSGRKSSFCFPNDHCFAIEKASGRLLKLGCTTSHPSIVVSCSFTNQVLAQPDLGRNWRETQTYQNDTYLQPKEFDEKVAKLHFLALCSKLAVLTQEKAYDMGFHGWAFSRVRITICALASCRDPMSNLMCVLSRRMLA